MDDPARVAGGAALSAKGGEVFAPAEMHAAMDIAPKRWEPTLATRVDDEPAVGTAHRRVLRDHDVSCVTTAQEALDASGTRVVRRQGQGESRRAEPQEPGHSAPSSRISVWYMSTGRCPSGGAVYSFECRTMRFVDSKTSARV